MLKVKYLAFIVKTPPVAASVRCASVLDCEKSMRQRAICEMREGKKNKYIIFSFSLISRLTFSCFLVG